MFNKEAHGLAFIHKAFVDFLVMWAY